MKLSTFDLNHVRALHFLLEEAHVARAAKRLGITPAAASNALRRLREEFDDELLRRVGRALVRTQLAEELRGPARDVLAATERLLRVSTLFEPATYAGDFVVTTSDHVATALLGVIDRILSLRAPRGTLRIRRVPTDVATSLRDEGGVAVVASGAHPDLETEHLFEEPYVCVLRRGHPLLSGRWTMKRFADAEHVLVTPRGVSDLGAVDAALTEHGLSRNVSRVVPTFSLVPALLTGSDRIATLPRGFAEACASSLGLELRPPPLALPRVSARMTWHPRHAGDPRNVWLREVLREAAEVVFGKPRPRVDAKTQSAPGSADRKSRRTMSK